MTARMLLFAGLLLAAGMAAAQGITARDRADCLPDVRRLCPGTEGDDRAAAECLYRHRDQLGARCRAAFARHGA